MKRACENHHRIRTGTATLLAASLTVGLAAFADEAAAARGDKIYENAWACSTLFSRTPIKVINAEELKTAICVGEGKKGRTPMSRAEAWELCRDQFDTSTQFIAWTSKGWHCRYYPR